MALCLLDTDTLSEILKQKRSELGYVLMNLPISLLALLWRLGNDRIKLVVNLKRNRGGILLGFDLPEPTESGTYHDTATEELFLGEIDTGIFDRINASR